MAPSAAAPWLPLCWFVGSALSLVRPCFHVAFVSKKRTCAEGPVCSSSGRTHPDETHVTSKRSRFLGGCLQQERGAGLVPRVYIAFLLNVVLPVQNAPRVGRIFDSVRKNEGYEGCEKSNTVLPRSEIPEYERLHLYPRP